MLPARHRIRRSADFGDAIRSGSRSGSSALVVHVYVPTSADPPEHSSVGPTPAAAARVGFVVSRAVGNAVVRNRVKRRLRGAAAAVLPSLPQGSLTVIRALPASAAASYAELESALAQGLASAHRREVRRSGSSVSP